jgi:hypothetical protein
MSSVGRRATGFGLAGLAMLTLAGCAALGGKAPGRPAVERQAPPAVTPPAPAAAPKVIIKPVRQSCVPKILPPRPRYPDTDAALRAAPGAADRYQLMAAGRLLRDRRLDQLERIIDGCR